MDENDVKQFIGKEMIIGLGRDNNRLVLDWENGGITLTAGKDSIESVIREPIIIMITPGKVMCQEAALIFLYQIAFKLGWHRFLATISQGEDVLRVLYLPDEQDI